MLACKARSGSLGAALAAALTVTALVGDANAGVYANSQQATTSIRFISGASNYSFGAPQTLATTYADLASIPGIDTHSAPNYPGFSLQAGIILPRAEGTAQIDAPFALYDRPYGNAQNGATVQISTPPDTGYAYGTNDIQIPLNIGPSLLTPPQTPVLSMLFTDTPLLQVSVGDGDVSPYALARLAFSITITGTGSTTGSLVWAPNGTTGGSAISGSLTGYDDNDPFSLNKELTQVLPGSQTYSPNNGKSGDFGARAVLPTGTYMIDIHISEDAYAELGGQPAPPPPPGTPEPASLAIWSGLIVVAVVAYRRRRRLA